MNSLGTAAVDKLPDTKLERRLSLYSGRAGQLESFSLELAPLIRVTKTYKAEASISQSNTLQEKLT